MRKRFSIIRIDHIHVEIATTSPALGSQAPDCPFAPSSQDMIIHPCEKFRVFTWNQGCSIACTTRPSWLSWNSNHLTWAWAGALCCAKFCQGRSKQGHRRLIGFGWDSHSDHISVKHGSEGVGLDLKLYLVHVLVGFWASTQQELKVD